MQVAYISKEIFSGLPIVSSPPDCMANGQSMKDPGLTFCLILPADLQALHLVPVRGVKHGEATG